MVNINILVYSKFVHIQTNYRHEFSISKVTDQVPKKRGRPRKLPGSEPVTASEKNSKTYPKSLARLYSYPYLHCHHLNGGHFSALRATLEQICAADVEFQFAPRIGRGIDHILEYKQALLDSSPDMMFTLKSWEELAAYDDTHDMMTFEYNMTGKFLWSKYIKNFIGQIDVAKYIDSSAVQSGAISVKTASDKSASAGKGDEVLNCDSIALSLEEIQRSYDSETKHKYILSSNVVYKMFYNKLTHLIDKISTQETVLSISPISP